MPTPYASLEGAQKRIPAVKRLLQQAMQLNTTIGILSEIEISYDDDFEELRADFRTNKEMHRLSAKLFDVLEKILNHGALVKDIDKGIVDFPSSFEGRDICLCWRIGEKKIEHWHEILDGYEDRKPIVDLAIR